MYYNVLYNKNSKRIIIVIYIFGCDAALNPSGGVGGAENDLKSLKTTSK